MKDRTLDVYVDRILCGQLSENNNIWRFQYASEWLNRSDRHALSPNIPLSEKEQVDGSTHRYIQWFFDNLLPEEKARELLAKDVKEPVDDAFALLEKAGAESAGAITLLPPGTVFGEGNVHELSQQELSERIRSLPQVPLNRSERKRMSLAGAQHKMLVIKQGKQLLEPSGQLPSTHILKPEHSSPDIFYHSPRNEWFCMKLAKACTFKVPEVEVLYLPEPVYLVERFDREGKYPNQHRLHMVDGCQVLGLSPIAKYSNSTATYLRKLISHTREKAISAVTVFRWALFNAIIGNGDAHLKNISFFMEDDRLRVTPSYDLVSTAIYEPVGKHMDHQLSQPMGNARYLGELTRENVKSFAEEIGLPVPLAVVTMNRVLAAIKPAAEAIIASVQNIDNHPGKAGELRMLAEIQHNCINEMCQKLTL